MSAVEYDAGGVLPPGVAIVRNNTGKAERIIPPATLDCPWPDGHHATACDWRLHVEMTQARQRRESGS